MRIMPFMKRKKGVQFAGIGIDSGGGDTSALANKTNLTAIILTGTTNTSGNVISAGAWFYLNGTPCVAKVDIASGATFTEGTNYEEKTVGSALTELNSNIDSKIQGKRYLTGSNFYSILNSYPSSCNIVIGEASSGQQGYPSDGIKGWRTYICFSVRNTGSEIKWILLALPNANSTDNSTIHIGYVKSDETTTWYPPDN